jgi:hypothetical protein
MTTSTYITRILVALVALGTIAFAPLAAAAEKPCHEIALKKTSDIDGALADYVNGGKVPEKTYHVHKYSQRKAPVAHRPVVAKAKPATTIVMVSTSASRSF